MRAQNFLVLHTIAQISAVTRSEGLLVNDVWMEYSGSLLTSRAWHSAIATLGYAINKDQQEHVEICMFFLLESNGRIIGNVGKRQLARFCELQSGFSCPNI